MAITRKLFSLIELLVIFAVISILINLLVPALGKTKAFASNNLCKNNLKHFSIGLNLFASDHDEKLPTTLGSFVYWAGKGTKSRPFGSHKRHLNPYLGGPYNAGDEVPIAKCPNDEILYEELGASYVYNRWNVRNGWKTTTVLSPDKFIFFADITGLRLIANEISTAPTELQIHSGIGINRFNLSFLDGHVSSVDINPGIQNTKDYIFKNK